MRLKFELNIDGTIREIEEPVGWDTAELSIKRDMDRYHGLFFGYTTSLEFIGDGFIFIEEEFVRNGFEGQATLTISMDCEERGDYEQVFQGELNFVTYNKKYSDYCSITMEVVSSAIELKTVNRQDILVSMTETTGIDGQDISGNTLMDLVMHNYTILYAGRWDSNEQRTSTLTDNEVATGVPYFWQLRNPICISFNEIGGMTDCSTNGDHYNNGVLPSAQTLADATTIFTAPRNSNYTFSFKISGNAYDISTVSRSGTYKLWFQLNDGATLSDVHVILPSTGYSTGLGQFSVPFSDADSFSLNMSAGQKIVFRYSVANHQLLTGSGLVPVTMSLVLDSDNFITVGEQSTYPETSAKASKIYDCFWKAISNYTGGKDNFYSLFFGYNNAPDRSYVGNGCGSYTAISNGYLIRGFPIADRPVFVDLKELFDSADAIFNIGLGFEQQSDGVLRCRVEEKAYFYSTNTLLAVFDDVNEIAVTVLEDICFNNFEFGFSDYKVEQGTDKLNTNNEFLAESSWKTVAKNTKGKLEKKSKYVGSLYPIEYTRRNRYINSGTKESKFDQDNFILATNRSGLDQCEKAERFNSVVGLDSSDEAYNLRFNLFSTLIRWSNIINSSVSRLDDKTVYFQYGALNTQIEAEYSDDETCVEDYSGEAFSVSQNLSFNDENNVNGEPIFEPILYEFDYPMSWDEYKIFRQYPQGTIIFGRDGNLVQGFIYEISYKPTQGMANYKILRSYVQNVSDFFPVFPQQSDFEIMGVITEYYGTMSIWDSTGKGTGQYSKWALCNGQNNTPDLRGQFIVAYDERDADYNDLGKTGGEKKHRLLKSEAAVPALYTRMKGGSDDLNFNDTSFASQADVNSAAENNNQNIVTGSNTDAPEPHENRPPYFVLAKIIFLG